MAVQDFSKLYYRTANCLTSDIIADFVPVSRVLGVDTSTGMGVVFTAMGTRFDLQYVAKEAFMATDNYEADTRSIDDTPVTEVMRYVRGEVISDGILPEKYNAFVEMVTKGDCVYKNFKEYSTGEKASNILFLISPAEEPKQAAEYFKSLCEKINKTVYCTNSYKDLGYLLLQMNKYAAAKEMYGAIEKDIEKYEYIVTDDSYVLDAFLIQYPELADKIYFIDEFFVKNDMKFDIKEKVVIHESGVIERLYPNRKASYKDILSEADIILPKRSGYDVTDSGIAGGLGLAEINNLQVIASRRMYDLMSEEHDTIVTPCASEALGLRCAESENVVTLLEYVCR